jgi:hypothetical protein
MGRVNPRIQARRVLIADARSQIARILDGSGLTTAEQVMALGELVVAYAGGAVRADHEALSSSPDVSDP